MGAIYRKEIKSYFTSMIGYVFIAFFLVVIGIYFTAYNLFSGYANFEYALQSVAFVFFILSPILTMRVMAEEKKQKTDQLLLTAPVSVEQIVLGKYLAVATVYMVVIAICCIYPLILSRFGNVTLATAYSTILGFTLMGLAFLAMGVFISTCTENQIVSAVVSFVVTLVVYYMTSLISFLPTDNRSALIILSVLALIIWGIMYFMMRNLIVSIIGFLVCEGALVALYFLHRSFFDGIVSKIFSWLSFTDRFSTFTGGAIELSAIVYMVSVIFLFLFLSCQAIKKRRWR